MFHRSSLMGVIMMMAVSISLTQTGTDANAVEVPSIFETHFTEESPVLTSDGERRLMEGLTATAVVPTIRIISIRGGKAAIGGTGRLPVIRNRKVVVGVAEDRVGRRVHFKVVRGDRVPAAERATATFPYEMSACFLDADGNSLFQLAVGEPAGDTIPECGIDHEDDAGVENTLHDSDTMPPVREQAQRMKATIRTMGALAELEFTPGFSEEFRALTEAQKFLRRAHKPRRDIRASDAVIILGDDGSPVANGTTLAEANLAAALGRARSSDLASPQLEWMRGRRHVAEMHSDYIHNSAQLADHSATYTARYEEWPAPLGRFYDIKTNCNHGRCPWQMTFRYLMFSAPRAHTHVHNWYCTTWYNPLSNTGSHNCHDDTVCTTRSVRYDIHWAADWGTPCSDPYLRRYAPPWYE